MQYKGVGLHTPHQYNRQYSTEQTDAINRIMDGKTNNRGNVTLSTGGTTTTVNDTRATIHSVILLMPTSAAAASALGTLYVSGRTNGNFTLTHAVSAMADRTFEYVVVG